MANLGGIAIWEGPIAYLMFVQSLKTDVHPLHVLCCQTLYGGSFAEVDPTKFILLMLWKASDLLLET